MKKSLEREKKKFDKCEKELLREIYRNIYDHANANHAEGITITNLINSILIKHNILKNPFEDPKGHKKEIIDRISAKLTQLGYQIIFEPKEGPEKGNIGIHITWKMNHDK